MKAPVKKQISFLLTAIVVLMMTRCANVVTPTGGPKDIAPPKVVEAVPENRSTLFNSKKIEITFDEYITLENAQQNVFFSPPLTTKPDIKLNNKTVVIKFKETLLENTTYTVHFGNAIKDLHEGNIFNNYTYTFSTGSIIDTLQISGKILDAETTKPIEDMLVGVYSCECDTLFALPTLVAPDYLTKTDKEGKFILEGLPDKKFLVFALKDMNSNLYYDMPNEMVAFLDTLVPASYPQLPRKTTDSLSFDTTFMTHDTLSVSLDSLSVTLDSLPAIPDTVLANDSLASPIEIQDTRYFDPSSLDLVLYAFIETDTTQMLLEKKLIEEGLLRFAFRHPADSVLFETPEMLPDSFQMVQIWSEKHDTLWWHFTPNILDSLWVYVHEDTLVHDSTRYSLKYRETKQLSKKAPKVLKVNNNLRNNLLMPDEAFTLTFTEPVVKLQWHDTSTLKIGDTVVYNELRFEKADSLGLEYRLEWDIVDTLNYAIAITDSVFYSLRGRTNDSLHFQFKRALEKDLGNLFITVVPPEDMQVIIQLVDSRDQVVASRIIREEQRVAFERLFPDKYKLKAIFDRNRDGGWSTGNFHKVFLPETVEDYPDVLDLKAGWDIDLDEKWILFSE